MKNSDIYFIVGQVWLAAVVVTGPNRWLAIFFGSVFVGMQIYNIIKGR